MQVRNVQPGNLFTLQDDPNVYRMIGPDGFERYDCKQITPDGGFAFGHLPGMTKCSQTTPDGAAEHLNRAETDCTILRDQIRELESENKRLHAKLNKLEDMATEMIVAIANE